ncbi:hypothetical protein IEC97_25955 [Neobacillus cucumis]|nr:hypothetical protein [Neobacillus cucumis]MBI0580786.1 hypothetical protein [Neobacillus cucumis]
MNQQDIKYETADLDTSMVEKIKSFEHELNQNAHDNIVVIAYQKKQS